MRKMKLREALTGFRSLGVLKSEPNFNDNFLVLYPKVFGYEIRNWILNMSHYN